MKDRQIILAAGSVLIISLGLFCVVGSLFITPLQKERTALRNQIESTQAHLGEQAAQLRSLVSIPADPASEAVWASLCASIPYPAQVACPAILTRIMTTHNLPSPRVSLMACLLFPGTPEFGLNGWKIHSSSVQLGPMTEALAELENRLPMAQISDIQVKKHPIDRTPFTEIVIQIPVPR